jgi:AraC-like DNA-binding protein
VTAATSNDYIPLPEMNAIFLSAIRSQAEQASVGEMAMMGEATRLCQEDKETLTRSRPDFERRIYAPHTIAAIVSELDGQGVQPAAALDGTELTKSELATHTTQVSYRQLDIVIRNALRLSNDPTVALRAGQQMHVTTFGMYGYALLSSSSFAEIRDFSERYVRVIGPCCDVRNSCEGSKGICAFEPLYWPNPRDEIYRFVVEFALSAHLSTDRDLAGPSFSFSRVLLAYDEPVHSEAYRDLFRCPLLFGQHNSGFEYELSLADGPLALADARTHAMARQMCDQFLGEINSAGGVAANVRQMLIEQPGRYPRIEVVAERLSMHPRALRRRLETEGTSFRDLRTEVRMRTAIEYLRKTQMTNEEIASRLGYSDAANFRHAFLRWTGKNPSSLRAVAGRR